MSLLVPDRRFTGKEDPRRGSFDLDQLTERMQRLLDQTFAGAIPAPGGEMWSPSVDIEEDDDAYLLEAELPGVKKGDVSIDYAGGELTISGELKERERKGVLRRKMRRTGAFVYRVMLPEDVDPDGIEARLESGVLYVRAPKMQKAERRKIEIKAS